MSLFYLHLNEKYINNRELAMIFWGLGCVKKNMSSRTCHPELARHGESASWRSSMVSGSALLDPGVLFTIDQIIPILNNTATGPRSFGVQDDTVVVPGCLFRIGPSGYGCMFAIDQIIPIPIRQLHRSPCGTGGEGLSIE